MSPSIEPSICHNCSYHYWLIILCLLVTHTLPIDEAKWTKCVFKQPASDINHSPSPSCLISVRSHLQKERTLLSYTDTQSSHFTFSPILAIYVCLQSVYPTIGKRSAAVHVFLYIALKSPKKRNPKKKSKSRWSVLRWSTVSQNVLH